MKPGEAHGRLHVKINAPTFYALQELAEYQEESRTEIIRRAIALMKLIEDERKEGNLVQFVSADGKTRRRLEFLY